MALIIGGAKARAQAEAREREREQQRSATRARAAEIRAEHERCERERADRWAAERERRLAAQEEGIRQAATHFLSVTRAPIPHDPPADFEPCPAAGPIPITADSEGLRNFLIGARPQEPAPRDGQVEQITLKVEL